MEKMRVALLDELKIRLWLVEDVVHVVFCPPFERRRPALLCFLHVAAASTQEPSRHFRFTSPQLSTRCCAVHWICAELALDVEKIFFGFDVIHVPRKR